MIDESADRRLFSLLASLLAMDFKDTTTIQGVVRNAMAAVAACCASPALRPHVGSLKPSLDDMRKATTSSAFRLMLVDGLTERLPDIDADAAKAIEMCAEALARLDHIQMSPQGRDPNDDGNGALDIAWPQPSTDPRDLPRFTQPHPDQVIRGEPARRLLSAALKQRALGGVYVLRRTFPTNDRMRTIRQSLMEGSLPADAPGTIVISDNADYCSPFPAGGAVQRTLSAEEKQKSTAETVSLPQTVPHCEVGSAMDISARWGYSVLLLPSRPPENAANTLYWWLSAVLSTAQNGTVVITDTSVPLRPISPPGAQRLREIVAAAAQRGILLLVYAPTGLELPWRSGEREDFCVVTKMVDIWGSSPSHIPMPSLTATIFRGIDGV